MSGYVITGYYTKPDFCSETVLSGLGGGAYVHSYIHRQPVILTHPSVRHTDEAQLGRNSGLWLFIFCLG